WRNTTYRSFAAYKAGTSQEVHSVFSDPDFASLLLPKPNLHMLSSSPCINSGNPATVLLNGENDYDGNPRIIDKIDMGAYEFDPTSGLELLTKENRNTTVYPNPFSERTTLIFDAALKNGTIKIYSVNGQELQEIKNCSGIKMSFTVKNLSPGIYFYSITEDHQ